MKREWYARQYLAVDVPAVALVISALSTVGPGELLKICVREGMELAEARRYVLAVRGALQRLLDALHDQSPIKEDELFDVLPDCAQMLVDWQAALGVGEEFLFSPEVCGPAGSD